MDARQRANAMLRMKLNGHTYQEISDLYKVSRARAHQIIARRIRQILDPVVPAKTPEEVDLETGILTSPYAEGRGLGVRIDTAEDYDARYDAERVL